MFIDSWEWGKWPGLSDFNFPASCQLISFVIYGVTFFLLIDEGREFQMIAAGFHSVHYPNVKAEFPAGPVAATTAVGTGPLISK